jgi:hypothetical protein
MNGQALEPIRPLSPSEEAQTSTQILAKPTRLNSSPEYKLQNLEEIESCHEKRGTVGRILRREGLFASQVTQWRRALEEGLSEPLKEPRRGGLQLTSGWRIALLMPNAVFLNPQCPCILSVTNPNFWNIFSRCVNLSFVAKQWQF